MFPCPFLDAPLVFVSFVDTSIKNLSSSIINNDSFVLRVFESNSIELQRSVNCFGMFASVFFGSMMY